MARTAIPITALVENAGVASPVGVAADPTNGHVLADASQTTATVLLDVDNTAGAAKNVTLKAGPRGSQDKVTPVPANTRALIVVGDSLDFEQDDLDFYVDLEAGTTGTVRAYAVPR
jgi:hypothetical protein